MEEEEEEEAPPTLRLLMLQGPREGETLDFPPSSSVRIGRVLRGNSLCIKDPGISSKHLSIQCESSKWLLRDLDSSNGTVLDASRIPPFTPFPLRHDSTIKIGELTSILVSFLPLTLPPRAPHSRRNPTRRARTPATEEPVQPVPKPPRARAKKGDIQTQSTHENVTVPDESTLSGRPARVTRNLKKKQRAATVSDSGVEDLDAPVERLEERPKSTTQNPSFIEVSDSSVASLDPPVEEPKKTRVTRNSKKKQSAATVSDSGVANLDAPVEKVEERPNSSALNPSFIEVSDSSVVSLDPPVEEPKKTRVTRNSKNTQGGARNSRLECEMEHAEKNEAMGVAEERESVEENCEGMEMGNVDWVDLEKMSLGEWFDFLEVYLPKQIIDATEEMIESMTQKAERLRKYITKHNEKVKMPVEG